MGTKKKSNITAVERITADFMEYELPDNKKYNLLLCNQVLEHAPQPALFMKKLISLAKISIILVPFNWGDCGKLCKHTTNHITNKKLLEWSAPHESFRGSGGKNMIFSNGPDSTSECLKLLY